MNRNWFAERLRSLARKMTTLAFVTWIIVTSIYLWLVSLGCRGVEFFIAWLGFTAAVIGIKTYRDINRGGTPPSPPATTGEA